MGILFANTTEVCSMAIIIPSKKIYNLKNDIIRNNAIKLIDIDAKQSNRDRKSVV